MIKGKFFWTKFLQRALFATLLLITSAASAQELIRKKVSIETLKIRNQPLDSLRDDTSNMTGKRTIITADAVRKYVNARLSVPGPQGPQGIQGIQGIPGAAGNRWFESTSVPNNATGSIGDFHLNRATGDYYEKTGVNTWSARGNLRGPQGLQGIQGVPGIDGVNGTNGAAGPKGDKGDPGTGVTILGSLEDSTLLPGSHTAGDAYLIDGNLWVSDGVEFSNVGDIQGPQGLQGIQGVPGSKWYDVTGTPVPGNGNVGDFHLNRSNGDYYEKTGSTTWTLRGNLRGVQGVPGSPGAPGAAGAVGPTGPQGSAGATGPAGAAGSKWSQGTGLPSNSAGTIGDFYLNNTNNDYYEKTGASAWTYRGNLRGAQGPPGITAPIINSTSVPVFTGEQRLSPDLNTVFDVMDVNTGTYFSATKRTHVGGVQIVDSLVDNRVIWKKGSDYLVRNFDGPVMVRWFVSDTSGTSDVTAQFQQAINTAIRLKKDLFVDPGVYRIDGTVYVNKPIGLPFSIYSNAVIVKDYQTLKIDMGVVIVKYNSGDIFRVNLKADGSPYRNWYDYSLNISFRGLSFRGSDTASVVAIRGYRWRGVFSDLNGVALDYLILNDWNPPAGYVGSWNNYCDQSYYGNIRGFKWGKGIIKTTNSDASIFNGFFGEYPGYRSVEGLYIRNAYGCTISNILHSNGNHEQNIVDTSSFVTIDVSRAWKIEGVHAEHVEFKNLFNLISPIAWEISGVHTRFDLRTLVRMYRSREGHFENYYEWANPKTDPTDVDFHDVDSTSTGFTWDRMWMADYETYVTREPKLNRKESASFSTSINRKQVYDLIYDKWTTASYNYSTTPNYTAPNYANIVLPAIPQNTTVRLLNPALYPGGTVTLINRNKNRNYATTFNGYNVWYSDSTASTSVPYESVMFLKSDSLRWNVVNVFTGKQFRRDSIIQMTTYLNVNNSRWGETGALFINANISENTVLDLPNAASVAGLTIYLIRTDTTSYYIRAKSVVSTQAINGVTTGDTIRGQWAWRIYKNDGQNWFAYKDSAGSSIGGNLSDGDKGDMSIIGGVWQIDNGAIGNVKLASGIDAAKIASGDVSNTEFGYVNGVTAPIQTQLNGKLSNITGLVTQGTGVIVAGNGTSGSPYVISTSGSAGEANTASNYGIGGLGLYYDKSGVTLRFKNLYAASNKVSIVDDATNRRLSFDVNPANFTGIPQAGVSGLPNSLDSIRARLAALEVNVDITANAWRHEDSIKFQLGDVVFSVYAPISGAADISGAAYTPTLGSYNNVSSALVTRASYTRVGKVVTVYLNIQITPTDPNTNTTLTVSIPTAGPSSNANFIGYGTASYSTAERVIGGITYSSGIVLQFVPTSNNVYNYRMSCQYDIP